MSSVIIGAAAGVIVVLSVLFFDRIRIDDPVGAKGGYIYYALDGVDDTQEIFLPLCLDTFLSPSLTVYKDIDNAPSWFLFGYFSCVRDHGKGLLGTFRIDQLLAERRQFYLWWGNREHGLLGKILISGFSVG